MDRPLFVPPPLLVFNLFKFTFEFLTEVQSCFYPLHSKHTLSFEDELQIGTVTIGLRKQGEELRFSFWLVQSNEHGKICNCAVQPILYTECGICLTFES